MSDSKMPAPADALARAADDAKARARAIIEARLAQKRGHGETHARKVQREGKHGRAHDQTYVVPTRPDGKGKRG